MEAPNKKINNNKKNHPHNFMQQYPTNNIPVGTYQPRKMSGQDIHP